jgi:hypothetical protein
MNYNKNNSDLRITIFPRKFLLKFYDEQEIPYLDYEVKEDLSNKKLVVSFKKRRGDNDEQ